MKKTIVFAITSLLALTNITFAQLVFDGGPDGTGTDFFEEANWLDTTTGSDPSVDTINPSPATIGFDLTIDGDFAVEGANGNIRLANRQTLTLEGNATLSSLVFSASNGAEVNIVLRDDSELTVTQNIARTAFNLSGNANLIFTGDAPEFTNDSLNLSSDWAGSITTELPNGNRMVLQGPSGTALFNLVTIDGVVASSEDIDTVQFGASFTHTIASPFLLGDANRDGTVDFLDLGPFIEILAASTFLDEADIDRSGTVDFLDLGPFIEILSGQ